MRSQIEISTEKALGVSDINSYIKLIDSIFNSNKTISKRFSKKTVYELIDKRLFSRKLLEKEFSESDASSLIKEFTEVLPENIKVLAPISGIRLDSVKKLLIGSFEIGNSENLTIPISNSNDYYICSEIKDSYDNEKSISTAQNEFDDFIRLIFFMAGKKDSSIFIKTGLPAYQSYTHQHIYVETSSYQIQKKTSTIDSASIRNKTAEKIPVDNDFFKKNKSFSKLWDIYKERKDGEKISELQSRILNCSISIGEALRSQNEKDSIIHTCIALEILLSYDEGSLFQKSIGDRLAETFVFIVALDKDTRIKTSTLLKKVYRMRSALVHGGNKEIDQSYIDIIQLTRAAISELLTSEKYKNINKIDALYEMVKDAQNSY